MYKTDLIKRMADRFPQLVYKDSENAVNLIIDELIVALATGDRVSFQRFGSFETREIPKRTGTNPRNGNPVWVFAKRVMKFRPGKELLGHCALSEYLRERKSSYWGSKENVGVAVLEKYSDHPDRYVVRAILENEKCTPELVAKIAGRMASSPDPADRLTVASFGKSCPPEIIRQLCSDSDEDVRAKATEHCPTDMFEVLTRDKSVKVRKALANRSDLTESAAAILARDKSFEIQELAANSLGACPKCGAVVRQTDNGYECANELCDLRCQKNILGQEISRVDMQDLLSNGRTALLSGFISNKTKRAFSAWLVLGIEGKIEFRFS